MTTEKQNQGERAGWKKLEKTARSLVESVSQYGGGDGPDEHSEIETGARRAAETLKQEICQECGGPGDPVQNAEKAQATRCTECRQAGDEPVPRKWTPARRRPQRRAPGSGTEARYREPLAEDLKSPEAVRALMTARYTPEDERGWHAGPNSGGWNHLLRGALKVLLLETEREGAQPWRLLSVKQKWGYLEIRGTGTNGFQSGAIELVSRLSGSTCLRCGKPGKIRNASGPGVHPACERCNRQRRDDARKPDGQLRRMLENRARCQGLEIDIDRAVAEARAQADALTSGRPGRAQ